jgi:hypothetical protein
MAYRIAGIDVHNRMLAVVVSDVEIDGEYPLERRMFGSNPEPLRSLTAWLLEQEVEEGVMASTAQYGKPVWEALQRYGKPLREKREGADRMSGTLHLAEEGFPRCRTTSVANANAEKVSVDAPPGAATEPSGVSVGTSPYHVVQPSFGSAGRQFPAHVEGARRC